MRQLVMLLVTVLGLVNCRDNSKVGVGADSLDVHRIHKETAETKFEIISKNDQMGHTYRSVESNFRPVSIQLKKYDQATYFANIITTTKASTIMEGAERNIKIKIKTFDNPYKTIVEIDKDCDNIDLQNRTYRTVKYGCCGESDYYEVFDYDNKLIVAGDDKIVTGFIPNSRLLIYVGFTREMNDSTLLGILHYTTTNRNRFSIKIRTSVANVEKCEIYSPDIYFQTPRAGDEFDKNKNEYTLWSFDKIENENLIDNLAIKFKLHCIDKDDFKTLVIPIINGKPFGKDQKIQELVLN